MGREVKLAHSVLEAEMKAVPNTNMKHRTPLRVFHPAANQRLSCRKITCKAFPFVVEEQRVTSYFFLVKKKKHKKNDVLSETLWIYPPLIFPLPVGGRRDLCCAPRGLFSAFLFFFAGVTWWKRLAEITVEQGSPLEQESKPFGCLLRWL